MTYLFLLFIIKQNILKDCIFFNNNCKIRRSRNLVILWLQRTALAKLQVKHDRRYELRKGMGWTQVRNKEFSTPSPIRKAIGPRIKLYVSQNNLPIYTTPILLDLYNFFIHQIIVTRFAIRFGTQYEFRYVIRNS
jgi:hypothetical protein